MKKIAENRSLEVAAVISRFLKKNQKRKSKKVKKQNLRIMIASYGARVRESVFKIKFRVLAGEFESIETSPGFVRLLDEN